MHLHHRFVELFLPMSGFSGLAFLIAQEGDNGSGSLERWGSMGAAVVISCLLAYIITQRDPKAQEKVAELIKNLNEKYTGTIQAITDKHTATIEKVQQENAIAIQGIVKDHKELMQSTIKQLVDEKRDQRKDLMNYFDTHSKQVVMLLRGENGDGRTKEFGP